MVNETQGNVYEFFSPPQKVALNFIKAIEEGDCLKFWSLISKESQGFYKGIWVVYGLFAIQQYKDLSPENFFIKDALKPFLEESFKKWIEDFKDKISISRGKIVYDDALHIRVVFSIECDSGCRTLYIPLVAEVCGRIDDLCRIDWSIDCIRLTEGFRS